MSPLTFSVPACRSAALAPSHTVSARRAALIVLTLYATALTVSTRAAAAQNAAQTSVGARASDASALDSSTTAFAHVTVVDVERGRLLRNRTIVVAGRRIARVTSAAMAPPVGARVIDSRGLYVIPGTWDMHAHAPGGPPGDAMARQLFFPLHVANGVIGVRHMFGTEVELRQRDDVAVWRVLGPRLVVGSPLVDGARPMWGGSVAASTAAEAERAVDSLAGRAYAFMPHHSGGDHGSLGRRGSRLGVNGVHQAGRAR